MPFAPSFFGPEERGTEQQGAPGGAARNPCFWGCGWLRVCQAVTPRSGPGNGPPEADRGKDSAAQRLPLGRAAGGPWG